jgi:beta-mannosidase
MRKAYDLGKTGWTLSPSVPYLWQFEEIAKLPGSAGSPVIPASVPGSVQKSLLDAGLLPDWNVGQQARECEWVENRHWIYETVLPDAWFTGAAASPGTPANTTATASPSRPVYRLSCESLDYKGWVFLNGKPAGEFCGTHIPWRFDLTPHVVQKHNVLRIIFDLPPRWLGQFGYSSRMREWKVRFNYTWDWTPRLVQAGIAGPIALEVTDGAELDAIRVSTDAELSGGSRVPGASGGQAAGSLRVSGRVPSAQGTVRVRLSDSTRTVRTEDVPAARFTATGTVWTALPVELWQPNGSGDQPLYDLHVQLLDDTHAVQDEARRRVGFRRVEWRRCEGTAENSDPWLCVVNGVPTFLQGVNYPPVLSLWADVTREEHRVRLAQYRDLGMNILRINACQFLESEDFYELCDEYGIMVWQEMPLTSSGVENTPPDDAASIDALCHMARTFVARRQHHPSLILWSGGNELLDKDTKPYDVSHPMLGALQRVFQEEDPSRRYIPTSPSGSQGSVDEAFVSRGPRSDVHGPWKPKADLASWKKYWDAEDALFYSEMGSPGAAPAALIRKYAGSLPVLPVHPSNPLYCLTLCWWTENQQFEAEKGHAPRTLEEYVSWSQARQAEALVIAVRSCKARFPRCGGVILWCGHDCFPCAVNTSIVDFEGVPKPAALALASVYKEPVKWKQ